MIIVVKNVRLLRFINKIRMKTYRLLFVCLGNICRSPAAENILRYLLQGNQDVFVDSAATHNYHPGQAPDKRMQAALRGRNIPCQGAGRQIHVDDFDTFDCIVTMDKSNYANVMALCPDKEKEKKVVPFMHFCSKTMQRESVPDPYFGGEEGFEEVVDILLDGCKGILRFLEKQ